MSFPTETQTAPVRTSPHTLQLIEGEFTIDEAREVLTSLINDKIVYHQRKMFSTHERFGYEDARSKKRIPELLESRDQLLNYLNQCEPGDKKLRIRSTIEIL